MSNLTFRSLSRAGFTSLGRRLAGACFSCCCAGFALLPPAMAQPEAAPTENGMAEQKSEGKNPGTEMLRTPRNDTPSSQSPILSTPSDVKNKMEAEQVTNKESTKAAVPPEIIRAPGKMKTAPSGSTVGVIPPSTRSDSKETPPEQMIKAPEVHAPMLTAPSNTKPSSTTPVLTAPGTLTPLPSPVVAPPASETKGKAGMKKW